MNIERVCCIKRVHYIKKVHSIEREGGGGCISIEWMEEGGVLILRGGEGGCIRIEREGGGRGEGVHSY